MYPAWVSTNVDEIMCIAIEQTDIEKGGPDGGAIEVGPIFQTVIHTRGLGSLPLGPIALV